MFQDITSPFLPDAPNQVKINAAPHLIVEVVLHPAGL